MLLSTGRPVGLFPYERKEEKCPVEVESYGHLPTMGNTAKRIFPAGLQNNGFVTVDIAGEWHQWSLSADVFSN